MCCAAHQRKSRLELSVRIKNLVWLLPPAILALVVLPFVQWGGSDDDLFILGVLNGTPYPPVISPSTGRFLPLADQEWRAFPGISEAWMFHGVAIIEYCLFCFVLFKSMSMRAVNNVSVFLFLATLPPVVIAFSMIVAPERNVLFLFALWFLFYSISKKTNDIIFGVLSLICATAALFFKEPTFLFFAGFSVIQLWGARPTKGEIISFLKNNWREIGLEIGRAHV